MSIFEMVVGLMNGKKLYRFKDLLGSVNLGISQQIIGN